MNLSRILMLFGILLGIILGFIAGAILLRLPSPPNEVYYSIANFDYVIPRPGDSQVNDLRTQSFIEEVIPYYNYSTTILEQPINIYLIDGNSNYTPFGGGYLLEGSDDLTASSIIVDQTVANVFGWKLGDAITLNIEGSSIPFSVIGISRNNGFSQRASMAILFEGMQKSIICSKFNRLSYSGAFVCVNNRSQAESYFTYSYVPEGKIGKLSWYENEELYRYAQDSISSSPVIFEITDVNGLKAEELSSQRAHESNINHLAIVSNSIIASICIIAWILLFFILRPSITKSFMMGISYKKMIRISWCSEFLSLAIPLLICNIILLNYGFVDAFIFNIIPAIICFVLLILSKMILIPNPKTTAIDEMIRNSQPTISLTSEQEGNDASTPVHAERDKINISDDANNDSMQGTAVLGDDQIISENSNDESSSKSSIKER